jgi:4-hydroxy 2-oxovalerate aldolase
LLIELRRRGIERLRPEALVELVAREFAMLQRRHQWGSNFFYYLSGIYGIHPTYVQQMLTDDRYEGEDIVSVLKALRGAGGESFSGDSLANAFATNYRTPEGAWDATGWAAGRDMLLVAAGPGLKRHADGVLRYIERAGPLVVCLNHIDLIPAQMVDAYAVSHPTRILSHAEKLAALGRPVILPLAALPDGVRNQFAGIDVRDFGMRVAADRFEPGRTGCTVPAALVAAYALGLARSAGAKRVLLAGFDGYGPNDPRHTEMNHVFDLVQATAPDMPLIAVTPSAYTLGQGTIYAPNP